MLKYLVPLSVVGCFVQGCTNLGDGDAPPESQGPVGRISAALELGARVGDVTSVRIAVVAGDGSCEDAPLYVIERSIQDAELPATLPEGSGAQHAFADALFVLAPGAYRVCATPLSSDQPSAQCGLAQTEVSVTASQTADVLLVSHCTAESSGGLGVVVALNQPPHINAVSLDPGKFISVCEALAIEVEAEDPNDDAIRYEFKFSGGSDDAKLSADGSTASFFGPAGNYELEVVVSDSHGDSTSLRFPVQVSDATCAVPAAVQDIFVATCSPCHITGSSGGLSLASAEASYANLVGLHSSAAMCGARVRVIPGDPAASYLMAKLRAEPGICGNPMPRGRPPLGEPDLATISAWIEALPH